MHFLTPGEKIKNLREIFNLKQDDFSIGVSRNFISMVENNKRSLSKKSSKFVFEVFKLKAQELNINLTINENYFLQTETEQALVYCNNMLNENLTLKQIDMLYETALQYSLDNIKCSILLKKGSILFENKDFINAFLCYQSAIDIYNNSMGFSSSYIYNRLGICKLHSFELTESLCYFIKAYNLSKNQGDNDTEINSLYNIALNYKELNNINNAVYYINEYLDLMKTFNKNDNTYIINAYILKANCYSSINKYNEAIKQYNVILDNYPKIEISIKSCVFNNLALVYLKLNNINQSLYYFECAEKIRCENKIPELYRTLIDKAGLYFYVNKFDEAINTLSKGIKLSIEFDDIPYIIQGYDLAEKIYVKLSRTSSLINLYEQIQQLFKDKLKSEEVKRFYAKTCIKLSIININEKKIGESKLLLKEVENLI